MAGLVPAIYDLLIDRFVEIVPVGIICVDQANLLSWPPVFDGFLPLNRANDGLGIHTRRGVSVRHVA